MTDEKRSAEPRGGVSNGLTAGPKITRRRFAKAGAIAPVIMTLGSRPVWGQGETCSFSGQLSGNQYATAAPAGEGLLPEQWLSGEFDEYLPESHEQCADDADPDETDAAQIAPAGAGFVLKRFQQNTLDPMQLGRNGILRPNDTNLASTAHPDAEKGVSNQIETNPIEESNNNTILNDRISCYVGTVGGLFSENDKFKKALKSDDLLKANAAAAILNILSEQINYGYEMHGLIDFLDTAGAHPEAVNVLICLNGRGVLQI